MKLENHNLDYTNLHQLQYAIAHYTNQISSQWHGFSNLKIWVIKVGNVWKAPSVK